MSSVRLSFISVGRIAVRRNSQFTSGERLPFIYLFSYCIGRGPEVGVAVTALV